MNFFEKIVHFLSYKTDIPTMYGWFHILCIALIVALAVFLCVCFKNASEKSYRIIVLCAWVIMVILEVYRELLFSFDYTDGVVRWDYAWYQFPFQLCATPLYTFPFVALLKDGKIRNAFIAYVSTFAFFGGVAVTFYPGDVLCSYLGINVQSMIHHGLQAVIGAFTIVYNRKKFNFKFFLSGCIVFISLVAVAMSLNLGVYQYFAINGMDDTFNMFFISPYFNCTLPILSAIQPVVPYAVFLSLYILGFCFVAFIVYTVSRFLIICGGRAKKNA